MNGSKVLSEPVKKKKQGKGWEEDALPPNGSRKPAKVVGDTIFSIL